MLAAVEPSALYEGHRANYQGTKRPGKVPDGRAVAPRLVHEFPTDDVTGLGRRKIPATKQKPTKGSNVCIVYPRVVHRELVDTTPLSIHDGDVLFVGRRQTIFGAGQNRITRTMTWRHLNTELARPENMLDTARPETLDNIITAREAWIYDVRQRVEDDVDTLGYLNDPRTPQNVDADFMDNYTKTVASLDCAVDVLQIATRARYLGRPYQIDPWFDWRAVPALRDWTVDGVLHNSEFAKEVINEVYPSSIDDEMLLNVAMQGPCHVRNSKHEKHAQFFDDAASPGDTLFMCIVAGIVAPGVWMYQIKPASSRQLCDLMKDRGGSFDDKPSCAPGGQRAHFTKIDLLLTVAAWKIGTVVDDRLVTGTHGKMNVAVSIEFLNVDQLWYMVGNEEIPILCITRQQHMQLAELRRQLALEESLRRMIARRRAQRVVQQQIEDAQRGMALAALAVLAEEAARKAQQLQQRRLENQAREDAERRADVEARRAAAANPQPERPLPLPAPNDWTAMVLYQRPEVEGEQYLYNLGRQLTRWAQQQARLDDYLNVRNTFLVQEFAETPWNAAFQNQLRRVRTSLAIDVRPPLRGASGAASPFTLHLATASYVTTLARDGLAMTGLEQNMLANAIRVMEMTNMPMLIEDAVLQQLDPGTSEGGCAAYAGLGDGGVTVALCQLLEQRPEYQPVEGARLLRFNRPEIRYDGNGREEPRIVVDNMNFLDLLEEREIGVSRGMQAERINAALVLLFNVPHDAGRPWRSLDDGVTWERAADDLLQVGDIYDRMVDRTIDGFNNLSIINGLSRAVNHCIIALAVLGSCNLNQVPDRMLNRVREQVDGEPGSLITWPGGGRPPARLLQTDLTTMRPEYARVLQEATVGYDFPLSDVVESWRIMSGSFPGEDTSTALVPVPSPFEVGQGYQPMLPPDIAVSDMMVQSGQASAGLINPLVLWRHMYPSPDISFPRPARPEDVLPGSNESTALTTPGPPATWTGWIQNAVVAYYPEGGYAQAIKGMLWTLMAVSVATPPPADNPRAQFQRQLSEAT